MNELLFFAPGTPGAKGSKRHVGNGRMIEMSKKVKPWEEAVCRALFPRQPVEMFRGDVRLDLEFLFERPASHGKKRLPAWSKSVGDLDKLIRSTKDALTRAGVWVDDAQVTSYGCVIKRYCNEGEVPGCLIRVTDPSPGLIKTAPKGKRDAGREHGAAAHGRPRRPRARRSPSILNPFI